MRNLKHVPSSGIVEPLLIRRNRRRKVHNASLHDGGTSSLARTFEHPHDSPSASLDIIVSPVGGVSRGERLSSCVSAAYNDLALALNDIFSSHKATKHSRDEAAAALQRLESLRQQKNRVQATFAQVNEERKRSVTRRRDLQGRRSRLQAELEKIQAEIRTITPEISVVDSTIKIHDSSRSSLFRQDRHLDNEIQELGNQQVVWELDMKMDNEQLSQLENECAEWRGKLA
ncbi:hypothetical protein RND71_011324 [Anisodus tanguticus]|uniref:Uncharacterized protein n=1 Tax=Anisodus tanguticus TaxID=243964 RepID=A0AAE1SDI9_9SOLA|nr:hypothetical protein RND71_011324 [Anisodus tanguticus]